MLIFASDVCVPGLSVSECSYSLFVYQIELAVDKATKTLIHARTKELAVSFT